MDFVKLTRLFLPLTVAKVLDAKRMSHDRIVERIEDLDFITRSVTLTANELIIHLQITDEPLLDLLLSGEANKFCLASRFSLHRACQAQDGNAAWQAVEHYYAAYYSVHYLLRICGISLTNLDTSAVAAIQKNMVGPPPATPVTGGLYVVRYNESTSSLYLHKALKKNAGGSHRDAWHLWDEIILKMQNEAQTDVVEYANTSVQLSEHRAFIVKSTGHYTPPDVRGEINYQFRGGVWNFEKKAAKSITDIQRFVSQPATAPIRAPLNVRNLMVNNKIIIELARQVFQHGAKSYPRSICRSLANQYSHYFNA